MYFVVADEALHRHGEVARKKYMFSYFLLDSFSHDQSYCSYPDLSFYTFEKL